MPDILEKEILTLKRERRAVILAHYYEDGDIQDIADAVGDSLFLAQEGVKSTAEVIVLAGVVFMAESVKILAPQKRVLVPDLAAGCSLVTSSPFEKYLTWRKSYSDHIAVTYVNSSAAVKAISDVVCTSSNAEKIIAAIPDDRPILFGPDKHLGAYLAKKTGRTFRLWEGSCEVHILFSARKLFELKQKHPEAVVLAHPECDDGVLSLSDVVGSTSQLLKEVETNKAKTFIVATEDGIFHQMKKRRPEALLVQAPAETSCACNQCPYMKLNNLEKIKGSLLSMKPEITLSENLLQKARLPLERMMAITSGATIKWPTFFVQ